MSALPHGYDSWKTDLPDAVYCPECKRAVDAPGSRKQDHDIKCCDHPQAFARRQKAASSVVRHELKGLLDTDDVRLDNVWDDRSHQDAYRGNDHIGVLVTVQIFVSDEAIEGAL